MDNTYYLHKNYKNVKTMLHISKMNKKLSSLGKNKFLIHMGVENSQQKRNVIFLIINLKF